MADVCVSQNKTVQRLLSSLKRTGTGSVHLNDNGILHAFDVDGNIIDAMPVTPEEQFELHQYFPYGEEWESLPRPDGFQVPKEKWYESEWRPPINAENQKWLKRDMEQDPEKWKAKQERFDKEFAENRARRETEGRL